jgi:16S rRNA (cytosine1402-N4)-methyltransferase
MPRPPGHIPVLLDEVMTALDPRAGQIVVDCTIGLGGHGSDLLRRVQPGGRLIGMDFDPGNIEIAHRALTGAVGAERAFSLHHSNFAAIDRILAEEGIEQVDAILADVGVASPQIDDPNRGFSYRRAGPLDMRMDRTRGQPASVLVNRMSEKELRDALLELGDETDAPQIAHLIVQRRKISPILTTQALTEIVCEARDFTLVRAAGAKLHPAARTFQALRMLVNRELANLEHLLSIAPRLLRAGGRIAVISFHSGEDRLVKQSFRDGHRAGIFSSIATDPIVAAPSELSVNPRSRSAKLRWAQRSG